MPSPFADSPEFARLLEDATGIDLIRVGLEIAGDAYPGLDPAPYLGRVEELAGRVRERCAAVDRPRVVLGHVNWVLFVEEEFRGNSEEYDDPRNSYLNDVFDRKTGIPITLSLIYAAVAGRLGLAVSGMNFPGHFMLKVGQGESAVFVDPFHGGTLLDRVGCEARLASQLGRTVRLTDSLIEPAPPAVIVARVLRNLKAIHLNANDPLAALPVLRRLAAVCPDDPREQRDLGMLYVRLGRPALAIDPLQSFLNANPPAPAPEAADALAHLRAARREVASWN